MLVIQKYLEYMYMTWQANFLMGHFCTYVMDGDWYRILTICYSFSTHISILIKILNDINAKCTMDCKKDTPDLPVSGIMHGNFCKSRNIARRLSFAASPHNFPLICCRLIWSTDVIFIIHGSPGSYCDYSRGYLSIVFVHLINFKPTSSEIYLLEFMYFPYYTANGARDNAIYVNINWLFKYVTYQNSIQKLWIHLCYCTCLGY